LLWDKIKPVLISEGAYMKKDVQIIQWYEAVRRRPAMYIGGTDECHLLWLMGELMECPERPQKITLTLRGQVIEIDSIGVAPSMRPRRNDLPPFLIEACTSLSVGLDQPPTLAGVELLDTSSKPATFRREGSASMALALANALSAEMQVCSRSGGISTRLIFSRGLLTSEPATEETTESDGLFIRFEPDEEIFGQFALYFERLAIVARGVALVRRVPVDLLDRKRDLTFTFDPFIHHYDGTQ